MASGHPVDEDGRVLPRCDWPSDRHAPGTLEVIRRFCNTTNLESGADRLADAVDFARWLDEQGHPTFRATSTDLARCIGVRDALRSAAAAHRSGDADTEPLADLRALTGDVRYLVGAREGGLAFTVAGDHGPVDRFVGRLVLAVLDAQTAGTWHRLKACRHCGWVVYDHSKNRSGQWCSMSACGGRSKVRQHRERRRSVAASSDDG